MDSPPPPPDWRAHPVWRWLPLTVALHALLPLALAALWAVGGPRIAGEALLALHGLTLAVGTLTLPWWWRHGPAVLLLVTVDHLVTAVVVTALVAVLGG